MSRCCRQTVLPVCLIYICKIFISNIYYYSQLLHFISGCVLNALLYGKEVSTATHGLRIKLAVSRIDEWLAKQDNDIAGTGERLNLLRDTANVLVLDKSLFLDADTITSIFHTLNLVQVRSITIINVRNGIYFVIGEKVVGFVPTRCRVTSRSASRGETNDGHLLGLFSPQHAPSCRCYCPCCCNLNPFSPPVFPCHSPSRFFELKSCSIMMYKPNEENLFINKCIFIMCKLCWVSLDTLYFYLSY